MTNAKLLIVGDAAYLQERLRGLGYTVCATVPAAPRAIEEAAGAEPDLALVDLGPEGGTDGLEAAEQIGNRLDVPVVLLADSGADTQENLFQRDWTAPPSGYVLKPFEDRQLHWNIQAALALHERERRHRETETGLEDVVAELRERADILEIVFDSMREGVLVNDESGRRLLANASALEAAGPEESSEIERWAEQYGIYLPDGETLLPVDQNPMVRALHGETTDWCELFVRNPQRPEGMYVGVSARPLTRKYKGLSAGVAVFQDITEFKAAQDRLHETLSDLRNQRELMAATFDSIRDGVMVSDDSGSFLYVNPAAKEMLGEAYIARRDGKWSDKPTPFFFYPDRETHIRNEDLPLPRAIFQGESTDDMDIFVPGEGDRQGLFLSVTGRPLLHETGGTRGGVITFHDVTRRVLADEALARAFAQGRLEIVDTILHNIGNAINSVTIGIETIHEIVTDNQLVRRLNALSDAVNAHRDDWADYVENDPQGRQVIPFISALAKDFVRENKRLTGTVRRVSERARHIADIVRTQRALGSPGLSRKDVNVKDAIMDAVRVLQESSRKRTTSIDIDCDKAPAEIRIDESQFHQMMVNLIKNSMEAIDQLAASGRLEEEPRIQVRAYAEANFLNIDVIDNGIGTTEKDTRAFFAAGYTTKETGTGLGLHSAANFVIGSGGQIRLLSDGIGRGTTAQVRLRALPPEGSDQAGSRQG